MESIYFNQQILRCLTNNVFVLVSGMFGVETEWKIVVHIRELGKAGFIPDKTVHSYTCRYAVELDIPQKFINEEDLTGYDLQKSFMDAAKR
jgi:hypothetical protein